MVIRAYVRVSHRNSRESGLSVAAQKRAIREYAKAKYSNAKIVWYEDLAVSAWSKRMEERPAGGKLVKEAATGDVVLLYVMNRGFRNQFDFASVNKEMTERGIRLESTVEGDFNKNAGSKLFAGILSCIAEYTSSITSERIREAKAIKRLKDSQPSRQEAKKLESAPSKFYSKEVEEESTSVNRVYGYIRCSHFDSLNSGLGLEQQESAVTRVGKSLGDWSGVISDEAISAFRIPFWERPGGKWLKENAKEGDIIVVYRMDRAWRNVADCLNTVADAKKRGVYFHIVDLGIDTSAPEADMYITLLSLVSQMESASKSRANKKVADELKRAGRPAGRNAPRTARVAKVRGKKKFVPDMQKIAFFRWMQDQIDRGVSYGQLEKELFEMHDAKWTYRQRKLCYGTKRGTAWNKSRIWKSLKDYRETKERFLELGVDLPEPDPTYLLPEQKRLAKYKLPEELENVQ